LSIPAVRANLLPMGERPASGDSLGGLVKRSRLALGLSQAQLADQIGSAREYVSQIESGRAKWPAQYVGALAAALGLRPADLGRAAGRIVRDEDFPPPLPPGERAADDAVDAEEDDPILDVVMSGARRLTPAGRRMLLEQLRLIERFQDELERHEGPGDATTDRGPR